MPTLKIDIDKAENLSMFDEGKVVGDFQVKENSIQGTTRWGIVYQLVIEPLFAEGTYYMAIYQVGLGDEGSLNFNSIIQLGEKIEFVQVYPKDVTVTRYYTKKETEKFMKEDEDGDT